MSSFRFILTYMKRLKLRYLLAIFCIIIAACFSFTTPLIIRFTVDNVLGKKPVDLPLGIDGSFLGEGFVSFVRANLWTAALAIVLISVIAHSFTFREERSALRSRKSLRAGCGQLSMITFNDCPMPGTARFRPEILSKDALPMWIPSAGLWVCSWFSSGEVSS